jgi:isoquinoline 1-oxidoreductase subunit beta
MNAKPATVSSKNDSRPHLFDRRGFITTCAVAGGGMLLGFWLPPDSAEAQFATADPSYRDTLVPEINAWITIAPDDTVTIRVGQTEMGQGVFTSNPMIVAEELQCDWKKVRAEYASANRNVREKAPAWTLKVPGKGNTDPAGGGSPNIVARGEEGVYRHMTTNSSSSVRTGRYYLQLAGAEARERLLLAAGMMWGVPVTELTAKDSVITHAKTKRRTTYGAVASKAAQIQLPDPSVIKMKTPDKWTLLGTEQKNLDVPLKITGRAVYATDVRLPGMLYAAAKACPVWGGDIKSYDFNKIKSMPGVHSAVRFGGRGHTSGGVAVVADTWWHAKTALDAMPIEWVDSADAKLNSASLLEGHFAALKAAGDVRTEQGNVNTAMGRAAKIVEATYTVPYVAHACLEPASVTAAVTGDRVDVWTGTQQPDRALPEISQEAGIAPEKVFIHQLFLGGGYGITNVGAGLANNSTGRGSVLRQAVAIAKTLNGMPVKVLWTREEDWGFGVRPRPMGVGTLKAALDGDGWPIAIEVRTSGQHYGGDQQYRGLTAWPYFVPNYRYTTHDQTSHVPIVQRRATGSSTNCYYVESFIDELAHAAGKDPYLYRREMLLRNPNSKGIGGFTPTQRDEWVKALDMVTKMAGWGTRLPAGWARGIAIDDRRRGMEQTDSTYMTVVAEVHTVEVTGRGQLRLHRVDVVFDEGFSFMNRLSIRKQIEGQIAWGYDDTMHHAVTINQGRAVETNFDTLPVSRMNEYPREVNIAFMKTGKWIYGAGEEAIPQVAPAICDAVFRITGKRIRSLPLKNHDLSWG